MQQRTFRMLFWTLLLVGGVVLPWLYHRVWMPVSPEGLDKALFERGIATPLLLWMNGYLGVFFNLRFLGNLGWLIVPMLLWAMLYWKRLVRWQRGLLVLVLLSFSVIGGLGGFNYRYAMTLLPVLVVAAFTLLWHSFEHFRSTMRVRTISLIALVLVGIWNIVLVWDHRGRLRTDASVVAVPHKGPMSLNERLDPLPTDLETWLRTMPLGAMDTLLVNNLPEYYYTTGRPGVYFWCGTDQVFLADGPHFLFRGRSDDQAATYLRDSLHCSGILSTRDLSDFEPRFASFLSSQCTLVGEEARGYTAHRITVPNAPLP